MYVDKNIWYALIMKGAVSPVLKTEDSEAWEKTALPTETLLNYNKLRAREIFNFFFYFI